MGRRRANEQRGQVSTLPDSAVVRNQAWRQTQAVVTFLFGGLFVGLLLVLAIAFPNPTPFQYTVFRVVLSLAAAGVAAMIPGFITVSLSSRRQFLIRAGGALAVFVIVYRVNPASLAASDPVAVPTDDIPASAPTIIGDNRIGNESTVVNQEQPIGSYTMIGPHATVVDQRHQTINVIPAPSTRPTRPTRPHQITPPPADFVGREKELAELTDDVINGRAMIGILGMPGCGKTTLAQALVHRLADRYPDGQIQVDMRGSSSEPLTADAALASAIHALCPGERLPGEAQLRPVYLSGLVGKRVVILADDAADAAAVTPLQPPASCLLIVTSRHLPTIEGMKSLDLDCLPKTDADKFLQTLCPRVGTQDAAVIAQLCGRLPLALRAAGGYLAVRHDVRVADYVRDLDDQRNCLVDVGWEDAELGVKAALNLAYFRLPLDTARVLRLLSVFPGSFDATAAAKVCEDARYSRLRELVPVGLVDYSDATHRYRMRDLLRSSVAGWLADPAHADEQHSARWRHAKHYLDVLRSAGESCGQGNTGTLEGLSLFDHERHNIEAGQRWAAEHVTSDESAARLASEYPDAGVHVLGLRLDYGTYIGWLEAALAANRQLT